MKRCIAAYLKFIKILRRTESAMYNHVVVLIQFVGIAFSTLYEVFTNELC